MSATNIQWITIAVLGFGAIFAFFVLVFIFEATVHALRYRDQYAGGGGGFRMPSFGGGRSSFSSGGESSASSKQLRRRDPQVDRALAKEAARIAADGRSRFSNESTAAELVPDERAPPKLELVKDADEEVVELDAQHVVELDSGQIEEEPVENAHDAEIQGLAVSEPKPVEPAEEPIELVEPAQLSEPEIAAQVPAGPTANEDASSQEGPVVSDPLVLTASHEVTLDKPVTRPAAGRVTMRTSKGPLIAAESKFRRHSTEPAQDGTQSEAPSKDQLAVETQPTSQSTAPQVESAETPTESAAVGSPTATPQTQRDVETPAATEPAPVAAIASDEAGSAEAPQAPQEARPDTPRPSKVAQPSQPEAEVMADTTRQLKSLRDAEQLGGGLQGGETSCPLYLRYRSASGIVFDRIVQAVSLEEADDDLIMRAYCHRSKAMRRIRTSNVVASFDLRNRDVAVGEKVPNFLRERVKMRGESGPASSSQGGHSPAAAE